MELMQRLCSYVFVRQHESLEKEEWSLHVLLRQSAGQVKRWS